MTEVQNIAKKIAVIIPSLQIGGAEQLVFEELSFLKNDPRFYFEVHVFFEPGPLLDKFSSLKIPIHVWNAPHKKLRTFIILFNIIRYLRRNRFEIIHVHLMGYIGAWIGKFAGLKVIRTVHADAKFNSLQRFCVRRGDLVFGCSEQVVNNLRNFVPKKKLKLLNNALGTLSLKIKRPEDILKRMGLHKHDTIVLSLGKLEIYKGYDILIEAFRQVVEKEPDTILLIGGDGSERKALEQQISTGEMKEHVWLLGFVNNAHELLEICDVYVNSSRTEGLPMTLIEAMAHRKPIIATDVGGNSEAVRNNETGILVTPERSDIMAEALLMLTKNRALREKFGEGGFKLFQEKYTIEKHCDILAKEYLA
ncbi:MAG: glycosyltransferase family 4 protein [Candidatus Brocadiaceae bacterium]